MSQHVREQDWLAIVLDFVIVVAGILIALQVTDWNERRAEHRREGVYLEELVQDLRADIEEMEVIRSGAVYRMSAIEAILAAGGIELRREFTGAAERIEVPPSAPFQNEDPYAAMTALAVLGTLDGSRHTYQSLIATGEFRLLRDIELARAIQAYYARVDEVRDFEDSVQLRLRAVIATHHRHGLGMNAAITLPEQGALAAADRQYAAELQSYWGSSFIQLRRMQELQARAEDLIERIEAR